MNDGYKKNSRRRSEDEDEGWVYPDRHPRQNVARPTGQRPPAYGYDARGESRRQVQSAAAQPRTNPQYRKGGQINRTIPGGYYPNRPVPPDGARSAGGSRAPANAGRPPMPPDRRPLPQKSRNAPAQTTAGARRTPPPFGSVPDRNGYFSPPEKKSRRPIVVAAIIVILILIAALIIIPKLGKGSAAPLETEEQVITETLPETEPEPEPQLPPYTYASRNADTKQLGDEISCAHAILIDVESNTVIAEKGGDEKIFPASMTKVMTALAAVGKCDDLNDTFTMTAEIVAPLFQANATVAGFSPGEVITVKDLLYGAILPSGADGTGGLAEYTSGSEAAFAAVMNEKCTELGLKGTHFSNASGLHAEDHYSTCHDIAIIFEAAMDDPDIAPALGSAEYVTTKTTEHPDGLELHHTLLYERLEGSEEFDEKIEVIGGKTGYTDEAGNCLVTMAKVASTGKRYVFVCAGGNGKWAPVFDTIHVYRNYLGEHYDGEFVPKSQRQD